MFVFRSTQSLKLTQARNQENVCCADVSPQVRLIHVFERFTGHDVTCVESGLPGDGGRGFRVIAGDHDNSNASRPAFLHRRGSAAPQRIGKSHKADVFKCELAGRSWQLVVPVGGSRNAQDPQPFGRHFLEMALQRVELRVVKTAKLGDGFGRAFRGDHEVGLTRRRPPDLRDGKEIGP